MSSKKALIIGAGIAGIAAAIRLAVKGYQVEVFEANSYAGGKISEIEQNDFRFDAGPSLLTMPQYIDELFELAGKKSSDFFQYQKLDTICKYFYEDGSRLTAFADEKEFIHELSDRTNESVDSIKKYRQNSAWIYNITNGVFLQRALHRLKTYLNIDALKALFGFPRIDAFRTMHKANSGLFKDERLIQYADRFATYNGSDPYQAPATLNVIPYLEQHFGAYFPEKGMYNIISSLVQLAESIGIIFHYNSPVEEIILNGNHATGIRVKHEIITGDVVISNMDVWFTYHKLLKQHPQLYPNKTLNQERSSSALIFYWGIKKQFAELDLHNIFFQC